MSLNVRAIRLGYYGDKRYRVGKEFALKSVNDFSHEWMHPLDFQPEGESKIKRRHQPDSASVAKEDAQSKSSGTVGDQMVI